MNFISQINNRKNTIIRTLGTLLGVGLLVVGGIYFTQLAHAAPYDVLSEITIPTTETTSSVSAMTTDDLGNIWFIQADANVLGKIDSSDTLTEYDLPSLASPASDIIRDNNGFLWISLSGGDGLLKIDPADGSIILNTQGSLLGQSLAVDPYSGELIGFDNIFADSYNTFDTSTGEPTGTINIGNTDTNIPGGFSFIGDRMWAFGLNSDTNEFLLVSYEPETRIINKYIIPGPGVSPPVQGSDGNIWYVDTDHAIHKFDVVTKSLSTLTDPAIKNNNLNRLTPGFDGSLWAIQTNNDVDELLKVDPRTGDATAFAASARYDSISGAMVTGPQNSVWASSYSPTVAVGKWQLDASPTPGAVRNLSFKREANTLTVRWQSPYSTNDGYIVAYKKLSDVSWTSLPATNGTEMAITDGIDNTSAYEISVTAQDGLGTLGVESVIRADARAVPHALNSLHTISVGDGFVTMQWNTPNNADTGWPVTTLHLEHKLSSSSTWINADNDPSSSFVSTSGLTNGLSYDFRMSAENIAGTSTYSNIVTATPATIPGSPTSVIATGGNTQAVLAWTAPTNNGGSAVTDYTIQYKLSSTIIWTTFNDGVSASSSATVTGLTNGLSYNFRVATVNAKGSSAFSSPVATTMPFTTPGTPGSLSATASDSQVALTWHVPTSNGGRTITDYLVEFKQHAASTWNIYDDGVGTTLAATVTGLINGTSYDFRVSAISTAGTGTGATVTGISFLSSSDDEENDGGNSSTPPAGGENSSVSTPRSSSSTETNTPAESNPNFTIDVTEDTIFSTTTPSFTGTYSPNTTFIIEIHSDPITARVKTDDDGNWTYTATEPLAQGKHTISVYRTEENGERGALLSTTTFQIQLASTPSPQPNKDATETDTQASPSTYPYWYIGGGILVVLVIGIIIAVKVHRRASNNNFL